MADNALLSILFLSIVAMVNAEQIESSSCYQIALGTLISVVLGDIALTVFIVGVTYCCASKRRQQKESADKVYMNIRANCKP